jgi:hypothetical protein
LVPDQPAWSVFSTPSKARPTADNLTGPRGFSARTSDW